MLDEMYKTRLSVALNHMNSVLVPDSVRSDIADTFIIRALQVEFAAIGYTLDKPVLDRLSLLGKSEIIEWRDQVLPILNKKIGYGVDYRPLFLQFPDDVPDDEEYFIKRLVGYITQLFDVPVKYAQALSCGHVIDTRLFDLRKFGACPICQRQTAETSIEDNNNRPVLSELTPFRVISLVEVQDINYFFNNLLTSNVPLSPEQISDVEALMKSGACMVSEDIKIVQREILAIVAATAIKNDLPVDAIKKQFKTSTDLLRLASALSDGDISLSQNTLFKLSNSMRRTILDMLDQMEEPEEDLLRWRERWLALARHIHSGQYKNRYPRAVAAINMLRNNPEKILTFNRYAEQLVAEVRSAKNGAAKFGMPLFISSRPGEFIRRLDFMLQYCDQEAVISMLASVVREVPVPMLMTVSYHLKNRVNCADFRWYIPKGNMARIYVNEENRLPLDPEIVDKARNIIQVELLHRFAQKGKLGHVYVDPQLAKILLPAKLRSASKSMRVIPRGSRIAVASGEKDVLRLFLYWENGQNHRVDVDLSASVLNKDFEQIDQLSFTNLQAYGAVHSGDIQDAPNGAAEFIDFSLEKMRANGAKYVAMSVFSYTGQHFTDFPAHAGFMLREEAGGGEIFEPRTVEFKFDVSTPGTHSMPLLYDVENNEVLYADLGNSGRAHGSIENTSFLRTAAYKAAVSMSETSATIKDLIDLHMKARADSVSYSFDAEAEYDLVMDMTILDDISVLMSDWLE